MTFTKKRVAWMLLSLSAVVVVACLAVPLFVIRPFIPQDAHQLAMALAVRRAAPWISAFCVVVAGAAFVLAWRSFPTAAKVAGALLFVVTLGGACLTHVNIFEKMFKPYGAAAFESVTTAKVDADDKVLAVSVDGQSHAFPVRTMGYHHIVNDQVGSTPIAATYCTLCHTGLIWSRILDGRTLTFRLAGINNGNALLRDEQTSSIWQQSTGEAIFGPLKGQRLALVHSDELTFAQWRSEQPNGLVLKPEAQYQSEYDPKDWERHIERTRIVVDTSRSGVGPHELMLGANVDGYPRAYPVKSLLSAGLIQEDLGSHRIVLVVGPDHASIRAFILSVGNAPAASFVPASGAQGQVMKDMASNSLWDFRGCVISGENVGACLTPLDSHQTYWFDWLNHNPATTVFRN